jgi:hypothetical protein
MGWLAVTLMAACETGCKLVKTAMLATKLNSGQNLIAMLPI